MASGSPARNGAEPGDARAAALVSTLISDLLRATDDLDRRIDRALARIGEFAGADRAYLIRIRDQGTFDNTHEWVAEGIAPGKDALQGIPVARMNPDLRATETPIYIASVPDLPAEAPHRAHLIAQGIRSMLVAPMIDGHRRIGLVGFDWVRDASPPDPATVEVLAAFSGLLSTIVLRAEAEALAEAARRDLATTELRLRTTLAAVPDAVLDVDASGQVVGAHSRLPGLLARPADTLRGQPIEAALSPVLARRCRDILARPGEVPAPETLATGRGRRSSGSGRWVELRAVPHRPAGTGAPLGMVFVLRDVTAERTQASERALLDEVARRTDNLVVVTDAARRITWVNAAFERRTGWTLAEVRGQNPGDFLQFEGTDPEEVARISAELRAGRPVNSELRNRTRSGETYWVELDIQPVRDARGRLTAFHAIQTDISDRKATEAKLAEAARAAAEAHDRLVAAVDALPDAFAYFDAEDRLILRNERYRLLLPEAVRDQAIGVTYAELMAEVAAVRQVAAAEDDPQTWLAARLASHAAPAAPTTEKFRDGRFMKVIETRTPEGGCVTMLVDVTAEHAAKQQLQDLIEGARVGTWVWHLADGNRLDLSDRTIEMLGYRREDLEPFTQPKWETMIHPEDRAKILESLHTALNGSTEPTAYTYRLRHRDGHWIWVESRGRVLRLGADGKALLRAGVIIDISDRKRLEADLEAERDYLETLMDTSMTAITALDAEGRIVYCNREAERLFGLDHAAIEGRAYDAPDWRICAIDGSPLPAESLPFATVRQTGKPVHDHRHAIEWPDGRQQFLSVNAAPVERPGSPIRVVCAIRDVTAEMAAETALHGALARAHEATEAKSRFLASMSHEIRTPLNGVLGMAELLALELTAPRHRDMVGVIRDSGTLLLSLLNDILDMSKIEAGKLDLDIGPFAPVALAGAVEALHTVTARRKGIDLVVWSGVGLDRPRLGDGRRIQQILHNLVGNAVKFTQSGEVAVTLALASCGALTIRVRDTGPGMTAEQLERVFEEFEQADGSIARRYGGSGLGLAIVRRLVDLMDGTITATSTPGQGTEIRVSLPLPEAPAEPTVVPAGLPVAPPPDAVRRFAGLRALVAEDNATNRLILGAMLDRLGIAATMAADGSDAVAAWQDGSFDLLLLDITMPVMGGLETLSVLRAAARDAGLPALPAVAITANAMPHQIAGYLDAGFDAHLPKPVSLGALEATIALVSRRELPGTATG